jgi:23S rRNA (cytidine2498-2'-O)-methyltransferase
MRYPALRLSYSRSGLITFKADDILPEFAPWLALTAGTSLGKLVADGTMETDSTFAFDRVIQCRRWFQNAEGEWEVDTASPGLEELKQRLDSRLPGSPSRDGSERRGDQFLEFFDFDPGNSDAVWLGLSPVIPGRALAPTRVVPPEAAPSRAYSKLVEIVSCLGLAPPRRKTVLELGAAPGGASLALLELGAHVIAVDPGDVAPGLWPYAEAQGLVYRHVSKKAASLDATDLAGLPAPIEWIVCDINLAPPVAMTQFRHALALAKKTARVLVVTFKINDQKALAKVPAELEQLKRVWGVAPEVVHLPSHRREFGVVVRR